MVSTINVDVFLKRLGEGISEPALVLGSDNQRYILKNQYIKENGTQFNCMFLNEIVAYQIAEHLQVPIPPSAIAYLDQRILENGPSIRFVHRFQEGLHFASKELEAKEDNLIENYHELIRMRKPYIVRSWNHFFDNINNKADVPRIIAFDLFIANFDRFANTGNLLVSNGDQGRKLYTIDHGHAFFGPVWDTNKMQAMRSSTPVKGYIDAYIGAVFQNAKKGYIDGVGEVFRSIEGNVDLADPQSHSFQSVVSEIEEINESLIDKWISEVPSEWFIDEYQQIGHFKHFLLNQRTVVRGLIQELADRRAFSNFRGGVLEWKKKRVGTL